MAHENVPCIDEVVDLLGLERSPRYSSGATTYMVRCPFCGESERKHKMKIDVAHGVYHCYSCGQGQKGTGTLDLYARVRLGTAHRKGPSGNGKEILDKLLQDLGRGGDGGENQSMKRKPRPKPAPIPEARVASDARLSAAYEFILHFQPFALESRHRANLLARGLDEKAIDRNEYASMPSDLSWVKQFPEYGKIYDEECLDKEKAKYPKIATEYRARLVAGLIIAGEMEKAGISAKGIPGSYRLGNRWCIMYQPGMLIPTRNRAGQVVAIQTRTDKGKSRYLTLSASGLPYGVVNGISRTHFPLANAANLTTAEVLVTEGPLKADVIAHLYGKPVFVLAVHGVSNVRGLSTIFKGLRIEGVKRIGNAFDMDKLCNTNVRTNSKGLTHIISDCGLGVYQMCWDAEYAEVKKQELKKLCEEHQIPVSESGNIYVQVARMADDLKAAKIPCCIKVDEKGQEQKDYWRDATKGLDDYLLLLVSQRKKTA